jgi:hypothetical protein
VPPGDDVVGGVSAIFKALAQCGSTEVLCKLSWLDWWKLG